ncbi:hypothetical protein KO498_12905 [Lentibacter algarum]|uniref:glyoxalase superfamily protein n=1 Tax=Lentibacter algarum TaxID=576131 RepID=UPI001C0977BF|nr:glyoxalase superfamily protein [Lentibacter algarum]MBU2982708.1 hypothetical protein [Lentibacter algarum]
MSVNLPTAPQAKEQAKRLRAKLREEGAPVGHAKSLEMVAHKHGYSDWNTMLAAIVGHGAVSWAVGDRVSGIYLSQPFVATVIAVAETKPEWFRLNLHLDEAVDVVSHDSFSNIRQRIFGVVGPKGHTAERTSDGHPHLQVDILKSRPD